MNNITDTFQELWFPGEANSRYIFDFTNDVLQIETPGFPLVPVDTNNFGNVITLADGTGYYILGNYLMDKNFSPVLHSETLFENLPTQIANCSFAPDTNNQGCAHLYFIDNNGLNYAYIHQNALGESSVNISVSIPLLLSPMFNSPLCILGDKDTGGNWLFYIHKLINSYKLVIISCTGSEIGNYRTTLIPTFGIPMTIDLCNDNISIVCDDTSLLYGKMLKTDNEITLSFTDIIAETCTGFMQSAFSADGRSLFYQTNFEEANFINHKNLSTAEITQTQTMGKYIALKCGPDNIIYGLSEKNPAASTLLTAEKISITNQFSISEKLTPVNGGYFPSTGWYNY